MTTDKTRVGMAAGPLGLELVALAAACYGYFITGTGTAYTGGALLVIISSLLIFGATLAEAIVDDLGGTARTILDVLLVLGFAGTILAGALLMNWILVGAMAIAAALWIVWRVVATRSTDPQTSHA